MKETRYPLQRKIGGPQGRSGRVRKTWPPVGFDPLTLQPVASRYAITPVYKLNLFCRLFALMKGLLNFPFKPKINLRKATILLLCNLTYLETKGQYPSRHTSYASHNWISLYMKKRNFFRTNHIYI